MGVVSTRVWCAQGCAGARKRGLAGRVNEQGCRNYHRPGWALRWLAGAGMQSAAQSYAPVHAQEVEVEETIHRLCPDYARETINSPLRHVRTRIYFTSEVGM